MMLDPGPQIHVITRLRVRAGFAPPFGVMPVPPPCVMFATKARFTVWPGFRRISSRFFWFWPVLGPPASALATAGSRVRPAPPLEPPLSTVARCKRHETSSEFCAAGTRKNILNARTAICSACSGRVLQSVSVLLSMLLLLASLGGREIPALEGASALI